MIARRLLIYLLLAAAMAIGTAAALQVHALRRAGHRSVGYHLLLAQNVGRFIRHKIHHQARALRELVDGNSEPEYLRRRLAALRREPLANGGVAIFDYSGHLQASNVAPQHLIPAALLERAQSAAKRPSPSPPQVTSLWRGADGRQLLALVVNGRETTAVAHAAPDDPLFLEGFAFFTLHRHASLEVIDSQGIAIFATAPAHRFRKVVGAPCLPRRSNSSIDCSSCHSRPSEGQQLGVASVTPIAHTSWRVAIREDDHDLLESVREITYSTVALVTVILAIFSGVFLLLHRRILGPLRQLVHMATELLQPSARLALAGAQPDEFETLAHSLKEISQRPPAGEGARLLGRAPTPPSGPDLGGILADSLAALPLMPGVCSAFVLVRGAHELLVTSHITFGAEAEQADIARPREGQLRQTLAQLAHEHTSLTKDALALALGLSLDAGETTLFAIGHTNVLDTLDLSIWLGLESAAPQRNAYVASALDLLTTQFGSLLERQVLYTRLHDEHEQKNRMLQHLFEAEEEERHRIARELHDETAQVLSALLVLLETFPPAHDLSAQTARLERAKALVGQSLDQAQRLVRRLRPAALEDLGLVDAVRTLGHNLLVELGISFVFEIDIQPGVSLPRSHEIAIYRVFQEALTNILRHAEAHHVRAWLAIDECGLRVRISDDGVGISSEPPRADERPHWGLLGMRERVLQLGGTIALRSAEPHGLRIDITLPSAPVLR